MSRTGLRSIDLSRRGLLRGATLAAGAATLGVAALAAGGAAAGTKFSQAMAKYQPTPKGAQSCANCTQFVPDTACKVVDGKVGAKGWCFLYARQG